MRDGRDHSVGCGHRPALSKRCTHHVGIGERGGFGSGKDPVGKTAALPALLHARGPLIRASFPDEGDLGKCHRRQCQLCIVPHEPGDHSRVGVLRSVSEMMFIRPSGRREL